MESTDRSIEPLNASGTKLYVATIFIAVVANCLRNADGVPVIPLWLLAVLHLPLLAFAVSKLIKGLKSRLSKSCKPLAIALFAALGFTVLRNIEAGLLTLTFAIFGLSIIEYVSLLITKIDSIIDSPGAVLRTIATPWIVATLAVGGFLIFPFATQPGVPDYKYELFGHVAASIQTSVSIATLHGATVFSIGGDLQPFGQLLLLGLMQFSGGLFAAVGLSLVRPLLPKPPSFRTVLSIAALLQIAATIVLFTTWSDADTPTAASRGLWSLVYSASSLWNGGMTLRPGGLAAYLDHERVFLVVTALSLTGSLGIPLIHALFQRAPKADQLEQTPYRGGFATLEAFIVFALLLFSTVFFWYAEHPASRLSEFKPAPPFEMNDARAALSDSTQRWKSAVYLSTTLRSTGLQCIPAQQGSLTWPSVGGILLSMMVGGGLAGTAGGLRISWFVLFILLVVYGTKRLRSASRKAAIFGLLKILAAWIAINITAVVIMWQFVDASGYEVTFDTMAALNNCNYVTGMTPYLRPFERLLIASVAIIGRWAPLYLWSRWMSKNLVAERT